MRPLPLHLIVIDGLHPGLLRSEMAAGHLPAFAHLERSGILVDAVSTFPTVTPAALASIATGLPPSGHGIQGIMWFDRREDRYVHYWPSPQSLWLGTFGQVVRDILYNLNERHLDPAVATVFDILEDAGTSCAAINFPICRGPYLHHGRVPLALALLAGLPVGIAVRGPRHLLVGDMLRPLSSVPRGFFGRYGISDDRAMKSARKLASGAVARFFLTYLPDNDLRSHHLGPAANAGSLRVLDRQLGSLLMAYGSWNEAVRLARWLIVGDHSQTSVGGSEGFSVNVYRDFKQSSVVPFGKGGLRTGRHDLAIGANDRSALIYLARPEALSGVLADLATWPSVDRIMGRDHDGWLWATDARGERRLRFRPGGSWRDERGDSWDIDGDPGVLDFRVSGQRLMAGRFPDALFRISGALSKAEVALTANPGFEFTTGMKLGCGNHGSLDAGDSITAMIAVGINLPKQPRITDVLPAVAEAFGLATPRRLALPG